MKFLLNNFIILCCILSLSATAQKAEIKITVSGSLIAATDGKAFYTNYGGPGIKLVTGKSAFSINMLPGLKFINDNPRPFVTPILGTGILYYYKKLIVALPLYYIAAQLKWKPALGFGIKIGK